MITGVNEKLKERMRSLREKDEDVSFDDVMNCVVESVAVGDCWLVSADILEDGMNETDIAEGMGFGDLPLYKRGLMNPNNELYFSAFTGEDEIHRRGGEEDSVTVEYSAAALIRDLLGSEECCGIVLNPWSDNSIISKENAAMVLEAAEKMPADTVRSLQTVRLDPIAVIDTNEILAEWREGWNDSGSDIENWKLETYPVMADGRILLLFRMDSRYYPDKERSSAVSSRYRVLEYRAADGKAELLNRYRFSGQDMDVGTVTVYDGVLRAVVSCGDSDEWRMLQLVPNDDEVQFGLYSHIETAVSDSRGNMIVAYNRNLHDESRLPLVVFNEKGEKAIWYKNKCALACLDINLDSDENVWFIMFPSAVIEMVDTENRSIVSHKVALQNFDAFALSSDRSKLFVYYGWENGGSVQFVMTADENGDYVDPIRFDFRPEDAEGNILEAKDCKVFGRISSNKNIVVLNADGRLYVYDVDDCCA